MYIYELVLILLISFIYSSTGDKYVSFTRRENNSFVIKKISSLDSLPLTWTAFASLDTLVNETGWNYLTIKTNGEEDDSEQAYQAGYVEGHITSSLIYSHWYNIRRDFCKNREEVCYMIKNFINKNTKWMKQMLQKYSKTDPWWYQVSLYFRQMEGLFAGYRDTANKNEQLTWEDIFMMNMNWDLETLVSALDPKEKGKPIFIPGSCSAIIKILPDFSDLLVAHNTWTSYGDMLRIMKQYTLPFHVLPTSKKEIPGKIVTFTSYPGILISGDDYYITSSGLVVMETTNDIKNRSLYTSISPKDQVMSSIRTMVANRLSESSPDWINYFSKMNSGTYNNQWMIIDFKKFQPGSPLKPGGFWLAEQVPGFIYSEDMHNTINEKGYWGSYNIPYFEFIYEISGLNEEVIKYGDWFSHDRCPRAKIFQRDHIKVQSVETMMTLMRYNDYKNDPFSQCKNCTPQANACNAIAARCDLNPTDGSYPIPNLRHRMHGAVDAKVSNYSLVKDLKMYAVSGPTSGNNLPIFQWDKMRIEDQLPHMGHPNFWNFTPTIYNWPNGPNAYVNN